MDDIKITNQTKKNYVFDIIAKFSATPQEQPLAVFAAGIPGAGKTEFLDRLFANDKNFVRIDLDEIVKLFPNYSADNYYRFRGAATTILDEVFRYCRHNKLNFVLDGTFGHKHAIENIEKTLKTHRVVIFYVWKDAVASWQLTKDREEVTKRVIEREGFIEACINIPNNLKEARQIFGDSIVILVLKKNIDSYGFEVIREPKQIDELLSKIYTKGQLKRIIL